MSRAQIRRRLALAFMSAGGMLCPWPQFNIRLGSPADDLEALRSDWRAVGNDLRKALQTRPQGTRCRVCGAPTDERTLCEACRDDQISQEEHDHEERMRRYEL